jgi:hypothetical protein
LIPPDFYYADAPESAADDFDEIEERSIKSVKDPLSGKLT